MSASPTTLPISRLVNVTATLSPVAQQALSLNSMLVLGNSAVIDPVSRMRVYDSLLAVAVDFGTSAPEYAAAVNWFGQSPQPTELLIGRWVEASSSAQLLGGALTVAQQAIGNFSSISNGEMDITIDGSVKTLTGLSFTSSGNLNAVAGVIQTALAGATCVWDPVYSRFVITSSTTGNTSTITFATAGTGGTNVSGLLGLTSATSGAYLAQGVAAESAVACVTLFDVLFGQQWYGLYICGAASSDVEAVAPYIQADTNYHHYFPTTQEAATLTPGETSSLAYVLSKLDYFRTSLQYSSESASASVSYAGRILTVDYTQSDSVIDLMYKQEPTVTPENLNATQESALIAKNCNAYVQNNNNTNIIEYGVTCAGAPYYTDTTIGIDSLVLAIQSAVFNLLYSNTTKVPQTDGGMHQIQTTIAAVCQQYVVNGLLAPGTWQSHGFGALNQGDYMPTGYYVYCPSIATQSVASRAARMAVPFQVAVKLAGAVNTVDVAILVNN